MTWYCSEWPQNIRNGVTDGFEDGDDCDEVFSNNRCTNFETDAWANIDEHGEVQEYNISHGGETRCNEHNLEARWDARYSAADDLRLADYTVCADCDATFHDLEAYNGHNEDHPAFTAAQGWTGIPIPPTVLTTHGTW